MVRLAIPYQEHTVRRVNNRTKGAIVERMAAQRLAAERASEPHTNTTPHALQNPISWLRVNPRPHAVLPMRLRNSNYLTLQKFGVSINSHLASLFSLWIQTRLKVSCLLTPLGELEINEDGLHLWRSWLRLSHRHCVPLQDCHEVGDKILTR